MSVERWETTRGGLPRAPRYDLQIPVRVRLMGGSGWLEGLTANVSRSGVLFRAAGDLRPDALLEMGLMLPSLLGLGGSASQVLCLGCVVRVDEGSDGQYGYAASIWGYRFVRNGAAPAESEQFIALPPQPPACDLDARP